MRGMQGFDGNWQRVCSTQFVESFSSGSNRFFFGSAASCFPVLSTVLSMYRWKVGALGSIYVHIRMQCMACN